MLAMISHWRERLRTDWRQRAIALGAALALEALILAVLLSMGIVGSSQKSPTVVDFKASELTDTPPQPKPEEPAKSSPAPPSALPPVPRPASAVPAAPSPAAPAPLAPIPPIVIATSAPQAAAVPAKAGVVLRNDVSGPPNTGGGSSGDSQRVGTAPNGEPMYAAAWYVRPTPGELNGYMSTTTRDGWGVIACRTVPDFRVDDCVGVDEYPEGSNYMRAILAAAWQFRVRPPFKGGQALVGSWVRIKIYTDKDKPGP